MHDEQQQQHQLDTRSYMEEQISSLLSSSPAFCESDGCSSRLTSLLSSVHSSLSSLRQQHSRQLHTLRCAYASAAEELFSSLQLSESTLQRDLALRREGEKRERNGKRTLSPLILLAGHPEKKKTGRNGGEYSKNTKKQKKSRKRESKKNR